MEENLRGPYEATSQYNFEDITTSMFQDPNLVNWLNAGDTLAGWNQYSENLRGENFSTFSYPNLVESERVCETLVDQNQVMGNLTNDSPLLQSDPRLNVVSSLSEADAHNDYDLRDLMLNCINQMLMEDDMEEKSYMLQQSAALKAAERSFYEVIREKYPPSPDLHRVPDLHRNKNYGSGNNNSDFLCPNWVPDPGEFQTCTKHVNVNVDFSTNSQSSHALSSRWGTINDGTTDFPVSTSAIADVVNGSECINKGGEEASRFLRTGKVQSTERKDDGNQHLLEGSRKKKNMHHEGPEGRSSKQPAVSAEPTFKPEAFDTVLLYNEEDESTLCNALQSVSCDNDDPKRPGGKKSKGKKPGSKGHVVDLQTLLTLCAQAVAAEDRRAAFEYLKNIRQHSTPTGDDMQRVAHYFADGLEARIEGSGMRIYKALVKYPRHAAKALKAYQLYLNTCPFRKISNFFSNKTITILAQNAQSLHIIDFGIGALFGFQWPCLIQRLSSRPGGPPKLRITGIDFPLPGFRPAERVESTGRLLAYYAKKFNVQFEFNAISHKWETITVEDLKIREGEVLVVNSLFRLRNLLDETVIVNSLNPRDTVLKLIHDLHPDIFIHGILNSGCNAPFFISRFRAALSHYSTMFDMLEATMPRDIHERMLIESYIFGRQAMNVIACEDTERIDRSETYKQWQVRNTRAGFLQLPLNREIVKMSRHLLKVYHKDFVIDEDGKWLLLGWKGRTIHALSTWKPT